VIFQKYASSTNSGKTPAAAAAENVVVEWGENLIEINTDSDEWQDDQVRSSKKRKATTVGKGTSSCMAEKRLVPGLIEKHWLQNGKSPSYSEVENWCACPTEAKVVTSKKKRAKTQKELKFQKTGKLELAPTAGQCAEVPLLVEDETKSPPPSPLSLWLSSCSRLLRF